MTTTTINGQTMTLEQIKALQEQLKVLSKEAKAKERNKDKAFCFRITEKGGVVFGMSKDQKTFNYGSWSTLETLEQAFKNIDNIRKAHDLFKSKGFSAVSEDYRYISKEKA